MPKLPAEAYAIIEGRHSDPFHYLGLHPEGGQERGARLPARGLQCRGRRRARRGGKARSRPRFRPVHRRPAQRLQALPAPRQVRRQRRRVRGRLPLSADPDRFRPLSARRRHPSAHLRQARRASDAARRHRRHRLRGAGAECATRVRGRRFQFLGRAASPDAGARCRLLGIVHPERQGRRPLQVRDHRTARPSAAAEIRSAGICERGAAEDGFDRVRRSASAAAASRRPTASMRCRRRCRSTRSISARGGARTATNG